MRTLLGSCVSITLWHPQACVGAMSHFLLPARGGSEAASSATLDPRYGDEALLLMLRALERRGVAASGCVAHIVGGGNMFPVQTARSPADLVGRKNGEAARAMLRRNAIRVASESLFGMGHRRVSFDLATGRVASRQVTPEEVSTTRSSPLNSIQGGL
jgi:chemotaxis protein CheD